MSRFIYFWKVKKKKKKKKIKSSAVVIGALRINYCFAEEFKTFAEEKPEYAPLFMAYQELTRGDTNGNAKLSTVKEETQETPEHHIKSE